MEPLRRRPTETPARLSRLRTGPIPSYAHPRRPHPSRRNHLVSPRTLARELLALVVRCNHPPHPPACPAAHPNAGRTTATGHFVISALRRASFSLMPHSFL